MFIVKVGFKKLAGIFSYGDSELTFAKCLEHSQPAHMRMALFGTAATIFASAIPALSAAVILSLAEFSYQWSDFFINGEAAIFCVGLLSASILVTAKELKSPFAHRQFFSLLSIGGLVLAMACYAGLCVAAAKSRAPATVAPITPNFGLALTLSALLYAYTITISFLVAFVDEVREELPNSLVSEARLALSGEALREKFRGLGEDEPNAS